MIDDSRRNYRPLKDETPRDFTKGKVSIRELHQALSELCEGKLRAAMTYEGSVGDGFLNISIPAFAHALYRLVFAMRGRSVLRFESLIDGELFVMVGRAKHGIPSRRELAEAAIAMRKAGFDLSVEGEAIVLRAEIRTKTVFTLYESTGQNVKAIILSEFYDFVT